MDTEAYLDALARDGDALAAAAELGPLDAAVPPCPGWTVADLVWHVAGVHWFWRRVVELRATGHDQVGPEPQRPADADLLACYRDGLERIHGVLAAADPATPVWTWAPQREVAFVQRRMAQETAVHRWDAEAASRAAPAPIEPALAADGIDEFFQFFTAWRRDGAEPLGGSVHVHATDGAGEWLVTESGERLAVSREHRRADAAARGTASELLLLLWRRLTLDAVEVAGDRALLARLLARTDLD